MCLDKLKNIERELRNIMLELLRADRFDQKTYHMVSYIYEIVLDVINEQDDDDNWLPLEVEWGD